jgi:Prophage minor tail protein Z (GPZ)
VSVKVDSRGAYRAGARFKSMAGRMDKAEKLAAISLHRAIVPETVRDMGRTHNLAASRIRASLAARVDGTTVELRGLDRPTGLLQYGAKASRKVGVAVTVVKAQGPVRLKHAFKATGRSSNQQIFQREGKPRLPIKALYGPSVAQILRNPERQRRLVNFSMTKLSAEIRRQLGRL